MFDEDAVAYPLCVRSRRPGDRMSLSGLNGSKKVQDIFVDGKVARSRRDRIPLVLDAEGRLLWIAGVRRSGDAPVTRETTRILRIEWQDEPLEV
jgi:tRNA(Ile)-lysidine synthase